MPSSDQDIVMEAGGQVGSYAHWATEKTLADCCKKLEKLGLDPSQLASIQNLLKGMSKGEEVDSRTLKGTLENLKGLKTQSKDKSEELTGALGDMSGTLDGVKRSAKDAFNAFKGQDLVGHLGKAGNMFVMPVETMTEAFERSSALVTAFGSGLAAASKKVVDSLSFLSDRLKSSIKTVIGFAGVLGGIAMGAAALLIGAIESIGDSFMSLYDTGINLAAEFEGAEGGLGELANAAAEARLTVGEFAAFIKEEAQLAVAIGAREMGRLSNTVRTALYPLGNLGMTAGELNEHMADHLEMQRITGVLDSMSRAEQARSTQNYLVQLTKLSQITGKAREQIEEQMAGAMKNTELTAFLMTLGEKEKKQAFASAQRITGILSAINPEAARNFNEALGKGNVYMTDWGKSLAKAGFTQETAAMNELISKVRSGAISEDAAQEEMLRIQRMMKANGPAMQQLYALARAGDASAQATVEHMQALQGANLSSAAWSEKMGDAEKAIGSWDEMQRSVSQTWTNFLAGLFGDKRFQKMLGTIADNLRDLLAPDSKFSKGLRKFATDLIPKIIDKLQGFIDWVNKGGIQKQFERLQAWMDDLSKEDTIGGMIGKIFSGVGTIIADAIKTAIWENKGKILLAIIAVFALKSIGSAIGGAISGAIAKKMAASALGNAVGGVAGKGVGVASQAAAQGAGKLGAIAKVGGGAGGALKGMASGLAAFANPATLIGLAGITVAIIGLAFALRLAAPAFKAIGIAIGYIVEKAGPIFIEMAKIVGKVIIRIAEIIGAVLIVALQNLADVISSVFNGVATIIEKVGGVIIGLVRAIGTAIRDIFEGLAAPIEAVFDGVALVIEKVLGGIENTVRAVGTAIRDIFFGIAAPIEAVFNGIALVADKIFGGLEKTVKAVGTAIRDIFFGIAAPIEAVFDGIGLVAEKIFDGIEKTVTAVGKAIKNIFEGISAPIKAVFDGVGTVIDKFSEGAEKIILALGTFIKDTFEGIAAPIKAVFDGIEGTITAVFDGIGTVADSLAGVLKAPFDGITGIIDAYKEMKTAGITATTDQIERLAKIPPGNLKEAAVGITAMKEALDGFTPGFLESMGNALGSLFTSMMGGGQDDQVATLTKFADLGPKLETAGPQIEKFTTSLGTILDSIDSGKVKIFSATLTKFSVAMAAFGIGGFISKLADPAQLTALAGSFKVYDDIDGTSLETVGTGIKSLGEALVKVGFGGLISKLSDPAQLTALAAAFVPFAALDGGKLTAVGPGLKAIGESLKAIGIGGIISTLADPVHLKSLAKAFEPYGTLDGDKLATVGPGLKTIGQALKDVGIGGLVSGLADPVQLKALAGAFVPYGTLDGTKLTEVGPGIKAIGQALKDVGIGGLVSELADPKQLTALAGAFVPWGTLDGTVLTTVGTGIKSLGQALKDVGIGGIISELADPVQLKALAGAFVPFATLDGAKLIEVGPGVKAIGQALKDVGIGGLVSGLADPVQLKALAGAFKPFAELDGTALQAVGPGLQSLGDALVKVGIGDFISKLVDPARLTELATSLNTWKDVDGISLTAAGTGLDDLGKGLAEFGKGGLLKTVDSLMGKLFGTSQVDKLKAFGDVATPVTNAAGALKVLNPELKALTEIVADEGFNKGLENLAGIDKAFTGLQEVTKKGGFFSSDAVDLDQLTKITDALGEIGGGNAGAETNESLSALLKQLEILVVDQKAQTTVINQQMTKLVSATKEASPYAA